MPGVARVSVRVVPDTKGFRETVVKFLRNVERTTELAINLDVDTAAARAKVDAFVSEMNRKDATLEVGADTAKAAAQIDVLDRDRKVDIKPEVDKVSLAKVNRAFAGIGGGGRGGIGRAGGIALAMIPLTPLALSSTAGLLTMAGGLSSLAAFAAPVPGVLLASAAAGAVFVLALKNAGTELASLNPLWKRLDATIQKNFWGAAKQPILDLVKSVFPQLKASLTDVSSALGVWAASVSRSFQKAFGDGAITDMMGNVSDAIRNSTKGTDAFAASIATLGKFGASYLPKIGTWFSDITQKFNNWVQTVASNGVLRGWVSNAMIVLGQLGDVAKGTWGIIDGLMKAVAGAGSGGLKTFAGAINKIADVVNSPGFQKSLSALFSGAAAGASGLASALPGLGTLLAALADSVDKIIAKLGPGIGKALDVLAPAIAKVLPKLTPLVVLLGKDFLKAVTELAPPLGDFIKNTLPGLTETVKLALDPTMKLVDALAGIVKWAAQVTKPVQDAGKAFEGLKNGTTDLGQLMSDALAGHFGDMTQSISQFVYNGGGMLRDFFTNTTGMFTDFGDNTKGMFSDFFANTLGMFTDFFTVNLPQGISAALAGMGQFLVNMGLSILRGIATGIALGFIEVHYLFTQFPSDLLSWLAGAGQWLQQTGIDLLMGLAFGIGLGWTWVVAFFNAMPGRVWGFVAGAGQWLVQTGTNLINGMFVGIGVGWTWVAGFFASLPGRILAFVIGAAGWLIPAGTNLLGGMSRGAITGAGGLWSFIASLPGRIIGAVSGASSWLFNTGVNMIEGLLRGIRSMAGSIGSYFLSLLPSWIVGPFKAALGINSPSKVFAGYGENIVEGLLIGIGAKQSVLNQTVASMVTVPNLANLGVPTGVSALAGGAGGASAQFPNQVTLVDQNGSLLGHMAVMLSAADRQAEMTYVGGA